MASRLPTEPPRGMRDILPAEAMRIESLRRSILDLFFRNGYRLVMPPLVEFTDSLLTGTGHDLDLRTFKLVDQLSGRTLGVRADSTQQAEPPPTTTTSNSASKPDLRIKTFRSRSAFAAEDSGRRIVWIGWCSLSLDLRQNHVQMMVRDLHQALEGSAEIDDQKQRARYREREKKR